MQMIGHKRFENEDEEYYPTPIPSEQLNLQFLMQGTDKDLEWFNEWKLSVRKKTDDPASFDIAMVDVYFKDEVCPKAFHSFQKAVRNWESAKEKLRDAK